MKSDSFWTMIVIVVLVVAWGTRRWLALFVPARSPAFAQPMPLPETTKNTKSERLYVTIQLALNWQCVHGLLVKEVTRFQNEIATVMYVEVRVIKVGL